MKNYKLLLGIVISLTAIVAFTWQVEERYARASDVIRVEKRLDNKILMDKAFYLQQRIWDIEDKYKGNPPYEARKQIKKLKAEMDKINMQVYGKEK